MVDVLILHVNGKTHSIDAEPDTPLIYVLRNDLGLKAAKLACGLEQCGACKVLVDGAAVPSCRKPVSFFQHKQLTTLEGLSATEALHPVQQAFIHEQAAQCGYCTAGMIIAAVSLLNQNPTPSSTQIREALDRNLCRCGTYHRIERAVRRAATELGT